MERRKQAIGACFSGNSKLNRALLRALVAILLASLAGCGVAPSSPPKTILDGEAAAVSFDQIKQEVDDLYAAQPGILSFAARGVAYTPETRDKVLKVCNDGGLAGDEAQRESQRVLACAPLILFFYQYGKEHNAPAAIDVAQHIYWFATSHNSTTSSQALTDLLKSWEIE